jgi:hypothetical protein
MSVIDYLTQNYNLLYPDPSIFNIFDNVITKSISAYDDENNNPQNLVVGATSNVKLEAVGAVQVYTRDDAQFEIYSSTMSNGVRTDTPALSVTVDADGSNTVISTVENKGIILRSTDPLRSVAISGITMCNDKLHQIISASDTYQGVSVTDNMTVKNVYTDKIITDDNVFAKDLNIWKKVDNASNVGDVSELGFSFRINDDNELEMVKFGKVLLSDNTYKTIYKKVGMFGRFNFNSNMESDVVHDVAANLKNALSYSGLDAWYYDFNSSRLTSLGVSAYLSDISSVSSTLKAWGTGITTANTGLFPLFVSAVQGGPHINFQYGSMVRFPDVPVSFSTSTGMTLTHTFKISVGPPYVVDNYLLHSWSLFDSIGNVASHWYATFARTNVNGFIELYVNGQGLPVAGNGYQELSLATVTTSDFLNKWHTIVLRITNNSNDLSMQLCMDGVAHPPAVVANAWSYLGAVDTVAFPSVNGWDRWYEGGSTPFIVTGTLPLDSYSAQDQSVKNFMIYKTPLSLSDCENLSANV